MLEFENLTGLNCEYIEDLETPKCDVTRRWFLSGMPEFIRKLAQLRSIIATAEMRDWSREDRSGSRALSIFTGFIEGRKFSTATRSTRQG
ncbi:hypothetical protein Bca4012_042438 [Brassica carinata]